VLRVQTCTAPLQGRGVHLVPLIRDSHCCDRFGPNEPCLAPLRVGQRLYFGNGGRFWLSRNPMVMVMPAISSNLREVQARAGCWEFDLC
jgi:hypothetical protein